jgi:hypothetical protein
MMSERFIEGRRLLGAKVYNLSPGLGEGVEKPSGSQVYVQVVELDSGRAIGWGSNLAELLRSRVADIESGIRAAAQTVAESLGSLPSADGWQLDEVSASFGITLTAEAGVILSKASTGATFDVSLAFRRQAGVEPNSS